MPDNLRLRFDSEQSSEFEMYGYGCHVQQVEADGDPGLLVFIPFNNEDEITGFFLAVHHDFLKVGLDFTVCPVCGSSQIEGGSVSIEDLAIQPCSCNSCESRWTDIYSPNSQVVTERNDPDAGCDCGKNCNRSPGDACPKEEPESVLND